MSLRPKTNRMDRRQMIVIKMIVIKTIVVRRVSVG